MNWNEKLRKLMNIHNHALMNNNTETINYCKILYKRYNKGERSENLAKAIDSISVI